MSAPYLWDLKVPANLRHIHLVDLTCQNFPAVSHEQDQYCLPGKVSILE